MSSLVLSIEPVLDSCHEALRTNSLHHLLSASDHRLRMRAGAGDLDRVRLEPPFTHPAHSPCDSHTTTSPTGRQVPKSPFAKCLVCRRQRHPRPVFVRIGVRSSMVTRVTPSGAVLDPARRSFPDENPAAIARAQRGQGARRTSCLVARAGRGLWVREALGGAVILPSSAGPRPVHSWEKRGIVLW